MSCFINAAHYTVHSGKKASFRNGCPYVERSSQGRDYRRVRDIISILHNERFRDCRSEHAVSKHSRLCLIAVTINMVAGFIAICGARAVYGSETQSLESCSEIIRGRMND